MQTLEILYTFNTILEMLLTFQSILSLGKSPINRPFRYYRRISPNPNFSPSIHKSIFCIHDRNTVVEEKYIADSDLSTVSTS